MPRAKRGGRRGNFSTPSRGNKNGLETSFVPFSGTSTPQKNHNGFTLQQEAINTGRNPSFWNTDQRLRDNIVSFVSAGSLHQDDPNDEANANNAALAEMSLTSKAQELQKENVAEHADLQDTTSINVPAVTAPSSEAFVIDTSGSQPVVTGLPLPQLRPVSPTPSNSSEEIILFRGKGRPPRVISDHSGTAKKDAAPGKANGIDNQIKVINDQIHQREELLEHVVHERDSSRNPSREARQRTPEAIIVVEEEEVSLQPGDWEDSHRSRSQQRKHRSRHTKKQTDEEAMIADYIANMAQEEEEEEDVEEGPVKRKTYVDQFRPRELGWGEADGVQDVFDRSSVEPAKGTYGESGWNTDDMQDFEGVSTSDGEEGEVRQILSKRDRKRGVSYLVIYCGQTFDDAKWVTDSKLKGKKELRLIAEFEAEERLLEGFIREAERMQNSDDSSDEDLDDDSDSDGDDEELLLQKKMERMSDEQIARLLAKQEELGMGSNELLLFDAEADEEDDDEEDIDFGFSAFTSSAGKGPIMKGSKKPGAKRPRGGFPPATALANAYDGFDVMDFERPSLKKKPKGRKGKLPVDISDSELEDSMNTAWENDRLKKKERKQEREELRAQGLLGSKNGKVDLKAKYKEGMGIEAVKEAIRIFLMNGRDTTLPLTPMDKGDRKLVHEFAQAFNLKSKSVGAGNKRFPVLYRTKNTIMYSESKFATIDAKLSRRFMKRPDAGGKKFGGTPRPARGGGFGNSAASYRDGDVVGASAPELGVENRGRAMLEKMGWSTGTALGALNNKGILQPVAHVVKTTKAGLG